MKYIYMYIKCGERMRQKREWNPTKKLCKSEKYAIPKEIITLSENMWITNSHEKWKLFAKNK
jgi:hypothetical protein